jgi:glucose/arabinose dehydrogenase
MFVDLGAATNSCQVENRMPNSPRNQPCTELETRAGTRLYEANKILQHFSPAERYATGLRNGERFAFDVSGRLFVTQHGRDQLSQNWSKFYTSEQSARQPAEEIVLLERGAYYGWPECYYDRFQQKLVLEPEYGGDAGIYQFVIVAMILAASGITGLLAILLMRRRVFSPAAQLILRR